MSMKSGNVGNIISIVSVVVSFLIMLRTNNISKNIANKTLKKAYFDDIFEEILIKEIPEFMRQIDSKKDSNGKEIDDLESFLDEFLEKITEKVEPIKYMNENLYLQIFFKIGEIEECVLNLIEKNDDESYQNEMHNMDKIMKELYQLLEKEYTC